MPEETSLRDRFAIAAMGVLGEEDDPDRPLNKFASRCYEVAEAMMKARADALGAEEARESLEPSKGAAA